MEFEPLEIVQSGDQVLKKTKAYQHKANEICNVNSYRVIYKKKNESAPKQILPYSIQIRAQVSSGLNSAQQFSPQFQCDIDINLDNTYFTIGKLEKECVNLNDEYQAIVVFNGVECLHEEMMSPIHLLVECFNLISLLSLEEHCRIFLHQKFQASNRPKMTSFKSMELIAMSTYQNKQKIKIQDISQMRGYPTCIQITQNCENQILEDGNIFRVGFQPQLTVRKIYNKFINFFQRYSSRLNTEDMIFEALQSLQSKVQFSGVDETVAELFMYVQDRSINKSEYMQRLEDENLMIQSKLYAALQKNCILLQTLRDENPVEHFLLVADQKNTFLFGRMEFSDIAFQSTSVSRNHGTIKFIPSTNKWIIMDGQTCLDQWKISTFGVWLQMNPKTYYFIDPDQIIKVGSTNIKLIPNNLQIKNQDTDNVTQMNKCINQREQEIEQLITTILDL